MSNLELLESEIDKWKIHEQTYPDLITQVVNAIPSPLVSKRMKLGIAISEIMLFASQFRINILHWNESIVPINSIMFIIARSGASKDSSLRYARSCFKSSYKRIEEYRSSRAKERAISLAIANGIDEESAKKFENFRKWYVIPPPLFSAISTPEGFVQHVNDLQKEEVGAGYTYEGEFASALQSNQDLPGVIRIVSQCYDMGCLEAKMLKDRSNQSKEIVSMPISMLMQTSHDGILYDESVKRRFRLEFSSKLARRSFFIFANEKIEDTQYASLGEMLEYERNLEDIALESRKEMDNRFLSIANLHLGRMDKLINVGDGVRNMFIVYKKYNEIIAEDINHSLPITKLTRQHMQWKCLKLAAALSLLENRSLVGEEDYLTAIRFSELIFPDVEQFEKEMMKQTHEMFVDYAHDYSKEGNCSIDMHTLKKLKFISGRTTIDTQMKELARLANSCDYNGIYEVDKDNITYQELKKSDTILLSYLFCDGSKEERKKKCSSGFKTCEITFDRLVGMMSGDYAYSPFRFRSGIRGKDNIISGCKWIVMDVDDSEITDEECHILLEDLNHIIARTSDPDNAFKYRVLLELDCEVEIKDIMWIKFIKLISTDLGIKADELSKSQIFFSYSNRTIHSSLGQKTIETKKYIEQLPTLTPRAITKGESAKMLENPIDTFRSAFEAKDKEGARKLIWAAKFARELGADLDYVKSLVKSISDYWVCPMPENRLETMFRQFERWTWS